MTSRLIGCTSFVSSHVESSKEGPGLRDGFDCDGVIWGKRLGEQTADQRKGKAPKDSKEEN